MLPAIFNSSGIRASWEGYWNFNRHWNVPVHMAYLLALEQSTEGEA